MDKIPRLFSHFFILFHTLDLGRILPVEKACTHRLLCRIKIYIIVLVRVSSKQREKRGGSVVISRWGFTKKNTDLRNSLKILSNVLSKVD